MEQKTVVQVSIAVIGVGFLAWLLVKNSPDSGNPLDASAADLLTDPTSAGQFTGQLPSYTVPDNPVVSDPVAVALPSYQNTSPADTLGNLISQILGGNPNTSGCGCGTSSAQPYTAQTPYSAGGYTLGLPVPTVTYMPDNSAPTGVAVSAAPSVGANIFNGPSAINTINTALGTPTGAVNIPTTDPWQFARNVASGFASLWG